MKNLKVDEANFASIREALKEREVVRVNDTITLVSFVANTEYISEKGCKVRTPFYYVAEDGSKYIAKTLKELLGLKPETKGERKVTTFASIWEQAEKLAKDASDAEISEAIKTLQEIQKARKEAAEAKRKAEAEAEAEAEQSTLAALAKKYGFTLKAEAKPKAKRNTKK